MQLKILCYKSMIFTSFKSSNCSMILPNNWPNCQLCNLNSFELVFLITNFARSFTEFSIDKIFFKSLKFTKLLKVFKFFSESFNMIENNLSENFLKSF